MFGERSDGAVGSSVMRKAVVVSFAMVMAELSCCLNSDEGAFGCNGLGEASDAGETHDVLPFATMSMDAGNGLGTGAADAMFC